MNSDRNTTLELRCYGSKQSHAFLEQNQRGGAL